MGQMGCLRMDPYLCFSVIPAIRVFVIHYSKDSL